MPSRIPLTNARGSEGWFLSRDHNAGHQTSEAGRPGAAEDAMLLDACITVDYPGRPSALRGVALAVCDGEIVGLAGESGSGKSTVALALMSLAARRGGSVHGRVLWRGTDLLTLGERELRRIRGREIGLMLQNPMAALNPQLRLATQFREAWRAHAPSSNAWRERALDTLARLGLPAGEALLSCVPGELSVGMAQRVLLALAILHRPRLLIADEPTSALDVITQSEMLALFRRLRSEFGMSLLIISHDLLALASVCDRITVLRAGEVVEALAADELFSGAKNDYTRRLIAALPRPPGMASIGQCCELSHAPLGKPG
ncbi:MAG TPA: ABC transporter ATP-binding protein [Bryobacteraceae bacterium]|nr:ABC transporter ATP-binding protein [Bryobacteraceae bacterium]